MTKWVAAIAILLIVVAPSVLVTRGVGAQGTITVIEQGVENQFPDGLRFYLEAQSASPIEEIRVYVQKLGQSTRSVYRTVEFEPGERISGEALFQSKTSNEFIPTGTRLSYYFDIRTSDGQRLETEPQVLVYLNRGLDWDSVSDGLINVYYYHHSSESENRANQVLEVATGTYAHMGPILGVELTQPMNLVVYSDYADMRVALPPKSRVAAQQLRTLGQAFTTERTLLVDGSSNVFVGDNILSTTAHEFTHLLVADAAGTAYGQVHTWLNEGLAVYSEGDNTEFGLYVNTAIRNDAVPPLASLRTYAGTPQETLRNYGLGHSVVTYLLDTYGQEKMTRLFAAIRTKHNFEKSLEEVYGLTIVELDNEWRESLGLSLRELSTPVLPAFQSIPTRRPTPTPAVSTQQASAPQATAPATAPPTPTSEPAPTYTPMPAPATAVQSQPAASSGGGCGAPPPETAGRSLPTELASAALLAGPLGLLGLGAMRRRRCGREE